MIRKTRDEDPIDPQLTRLAHRLIAALVAAILLGSIWLTHHLFTVHFK